MAGIRFQTEYDRSFEYRGGRRTREPTENSQFAGKESTKMYPCIEPPMQRKKRITGPYAEDHVHLDNQGGHEDDFMLIGKQDEMFAPSIPYRNSAKAPFRRPRPTTAPLGGRNRRGRTKKEMGPLAEYYQRDVGNFEIPTPETPRIEKQLTRPMTAYPQRRPSRSPVRNDTYFKKSSSQPRRQPKLSNSVTQTKETTNLEDALRVAAGIRTGGNYGERPATQGGRGRSPLKERPPWRYSRSHSPPRRRAQRAYNSYEKKDPPRYENGNRGFNENGGRPKYTRLNNETAYPVNNFRKDYDDHNGYDPVDRVRHDYDDHNGYDPVDHAQKDYDDRNGYDRNDLVEKYHGDRNGYDPVDRAQKDYDDRNGYDPVDRVRHDYDDRSGYDRFDRFQKDRGDRNEFHSRPRQQNEADNYQRYKYRERKPREETYGNYDLRQNDKPLIKSFDDGLDREISKLRAKNDRSMKHSGTLEVGNREEPSNNYARKHKLGLAGAKRPVPMQRQSEYRRQYEWKKSFQDTPLIDAKDVVHRSRLEPPKALPTQSKTEYRRQFAPMPQPRHRSLSPEPRLGMSAPVRSRSTVPQQKRIPPPVVKVDGKEYQAYQTLNPQRMSFPLGPSRRVLSEYSDNFRTFVPEAPVWYQQIVDLRQKAQEYRQRGRGTHFAREHLVQLMSNSNNDWDPPTTSPRYQDTDRPPAGIQTFQNFRPRSCPPAPNDEFEGRVPTPRIEAPTRHHLDKTTPAVGGTILTAPKLQICPPDNRIERRLSSSKESSGGTPARNKFRLDLAAAGKPSRDTHELLDEEASHDTPINKTEECTHQIRGTRSSNKSFLMKTPAAKAVKNSRISRPPASKSSELALTNGYASKTRARDVSDEESQPRTPLGHPRAAVRDDHLSSSIRSLVSSSSLASDTLKRARQRRDEFWRDG